MNEQQINAIVASVLAQIKGKQQPLIPDPSLLPPVPVEPSARHMHLTTEALEKLFGSGAALTQTRTLTQPGEFLSGQRVHVVTAKGMLERVAVLGPVRRAVQVELSLTDCRALGIGAPVRLSGDLNGAADVVLAGPAGIYEAKGAAIVAQRHIHMTPEDALRFDVQDGQTVTVQVKSARPVTFEQVAVRVSKNFALAMHIDIDEANACLLRRGDVGILNAQCAMRNFDGPLAPAAIMEEKVVTEALAKNLAKQGSPAVLRQGTIVTPSARDIFSQAHISIEFR